MEKSSEEPEMSSFGDNQPCINITVKHISSFSVTTSDSALAFHAVHDESHLGSGQFQESLEVGVKTLPEME